MEHTNVAQGPPWLFWNGGPSQHSIIVEHVKQISKKATYEIVISTLALKQTQEAKNQIDLVESHSIWDDYKKITNPYEYVFLSLSRRMSRSVSTRIPLSRSYYKMLELWIGADLFKDLKSLAQRDGGLLTAHAAEGPGGFIEAIHDNNKVKKSLAMTLRSTTRNIPGWRKTSAFLAKHPEITITYGATDTGDLLLLENIDYFVDKFGPEKAHIYTADGGFDFSSDFNAQEETILPLLTAEFYLGLKSICRGGCIVVKIFDTTLRPTLELLWLTTLCFREWSAIKPRTSRGGNAERYLVCKGFLGLDSDTDDFFRKSMDLYAQGQIIQSFLKTPLPLTFIQTMLSIQEAIAHQETIVIEKTIEIIKNPVESNISAYIEQNVERSIQWCQEHNEPINPKWYEQEWHAKTVKDEIRDLLNGYEQKNSFTPWRGLTEASQTDSREHHRPQQKHHAALFARSRPVRVDVSASRARRQGNPDEEGWQKV